MNNITKMLGMILVFLSLLIICDVACKRKSRSGSTQHNKQLEMHTVLVRYNIDGDITHYYVTDNVSRRTVTFGFYNNHCRSCETYFLNDGSMAVELELKEGSSKQQVLDKLGNYAEKNVSSRGKFINEKKVVENNNFEE